MKTRVFSRMFRASLLGATMLGAALFGSAPAGAAATAPAAITVGTLYASSGTFSSISMPVYQGLKLWVDQINAQGGAFVKAYGKKIPIKLIAYNDQSSTTTATTLYNQLITQDKVDLLVADSGSVLTSVAVPLAVEHKMLLLDQTGTGTNFFTKSNKYIVLLDDPASSIWPHRVAEFLVNDASKHGIKRVAILYSTNDFTASQAEAMHDYLEQAKGKTKVVFYQGVPTSTSNYLVLLHKIKATHPDAVLEFGYPDNDIAFLKNLNVSGMKFPMVFAVYPGLETELLRKNIGDQAIMHDFTYVPATGVKYKPTFGMDFARFKTAYQKEYGKNADVGFNAIGGYNTGLIIQKALATSDSMDQLALRKAIFALSGNLTTLDGSFELEPDGMQKGELMPVGQIQKSGNGISLVPVYPLEEAEGKPVFGKKN